jgi:lauroyl/myristoyl acyltransferase
MEFLLYWTARGLVAFLQALPLPWGARLGRAGGALFFWVDARHRRVARSNLALSFPEKSPAEVEALARENFRRVGENFASAVKTAIMTPEELASHVEFHNAEAILRATSNGGPTSAMFAIGHFGNFEIYARANLCLPGFQMSTTYRALRQPSLNRLMQSLREKSGCLYFERRLEGDEVRALLTRKHLLLGLLSDQHGGQRGLRLPFFGRDASTNPGPAVLALRYHLPLFTGFCFRTGLAHWRLEVGEEIPTHENGEPRSTLDIMRDVNRAFEAAVRRDPANWFWVHNRWKSPGRATADPQEKADSAKASAEGMMGD